MGAAFLSSKIAGMAGVSPQAVTKARQRGHLVCIAGSTKLDPDVSVNPRWIERRAKLRIDGFGRPLKRPMSGASHQHSWADPSVLFSDWGVLQIDPDRADALLKSILSAGGNPVALIVAMLEGLRSEVAHHLLDIRRDLADLPSPQKRPTTALDAPPPEHPKLVRLGDQ